MNIQLDTGSGGRASHRLISELFLKYFNNEILCTMDDAAKLKIASPIAMSTDSYTVTPLFFSGGSIGTLAVHGTVNDISMLGARPKYLSCGFIIEEGLELDTLERIVKDMAEAAATARVLIVTGDTKVVPKGGCDKLFINTAGIGEIISEPSPSGHSAAPGDLILLSGTIGDHGLAVMAGREKLSFLSQVQSDSAPLNTMVENLITQVGEIHVLRDPTRGGLATTLNEIAEQSGVACYLNESAIPMNENTASCCEVLGLDPLYLANEGKCICIVPKSKAKAALNVMKSSPYGENAAIVGEITESDRPLVALRTRMGGSRLLSMLEGAQLPRIC